MLTDDFLASLPEDPELAFVMLVDRLDHWLEEQGAPQRGDFFYELQYADAVRAFADECNLEAPFRAYVRSSFASDKDYWERFSQDVRYCKNRLQFRHKLGSRMLANSSISINNERRAEIHALLDKIRKVVAVLDVPERKRDALYARVSALAREVDTSQTRFTTVMALILEASETGGKAAENLDPLTKLVQRVTSIFADQRAEAKQKQLPAPPEQKRIAPPRDDTDEEIPF